jgi:transposase, IS5 family
MRRKLRGQWSFTDPWLSAEPAQELAAMSALLASHPTAAAEVEQDLEAARQRHGKGWSAGGLGGDQVLRALVLKQMHGFSYRALAFHLADSRTYRSFCRLGWSDPEPSKSALAAGIKAVRPATLESVNCGLVTMAAAQKIETGAKVRVDTTVVESPIHWPADSELLWDGVRVLTRQMQRARTLLGERCPSFSDRLRRAKRRRLEVLNAKDRKARRRAYRDLLHVTEEVVGWARQVEQALQLQGDGDPRRATLAVELTRFISLTEQVIGQTRRRVLEGESVPAGEKVVSLFEDHTDIIRKDRRETLYGHKICLTSGASSLILDCLVLKGNPADSSLAETMIERQVDLYGRAPRQAAFDGGFTSKPNLAALKAQGVRDVAFSKRRDLEIGDMTRSTRIYRQLRHFRAGIEGVISWLKRVFGLDRCTWRSLASFHAYVWSSILSCNLLVLARHLLL